MLVCQTMHNALRSSGPHAAESSRCAAPSEPACSSAQLEIAEVSASASREADGDAAGGSLQILACACPILGGERRVRGQETDELCGDFARHSAGQVASGRVAQQRLVRLLAQGQVRLERQITGKLEVPDREQRCVLDEQRVA